VTTRLLLLQSPAQRLTISIYGYNAAEDKNEQEQLEPSGNEDWTWLSEWAGGLDGLLDLLDDGISPWIVDIALSCLDMLSPWDAIVNHPNALPFLLSLPSYPPQPLLQRLYSQPRYALHPSLRHYLPPSHPLRPLVMGDLAKRRAAAWARLDLGLGPLLVLKEDEVDDLMVLVDGKSNIWRLLELAESISAQTERREELELCLDLLSKADNLDSVTPRIVRIFVISSMRNGIRTLPPLRARHALTALLHLSTEVFDGKLAFDTCLELAAPFLPQLPPSDPLRLAFGRAAIEYPEPTTRFAKELDQPSPSALLHKVTAEDILALVAPRFLAELQTAPVPSLGIPSRSSKAIDSQASTWAGKVYTSHEFRRDREVAPTGLGVNPSTTQIAAPTRMSRPASKHVDEYARA
jgi:hypothetical protein